MAKSTRPPWKKSNPRKSGGTSSRKMTPSQKASAKRRAKKAGRPYPNLVDNIQAASKKRASKKTRKRAKKRK